ncbi:S-adenosyl-L-methionine-dependent methyltransferase [Schizothecium vesticola]|uniref:S-adenosyl-L-methionine-dependent methyltransferase n=1 Tax=Schizothecium vesticola TaxID=314040 RepID=A0AA40BKM9_9PEZI|nr:S-adenosyl-L-methionine-dependent methyltransferase [Schizothecium vesticola]
MAPTRPPATSDGRPESTTSLTASLFDYRKIHGRTYQNSQTTEYWAPIDEEQAEGLDITHHFMTLLFDDKFMFSNVGTGTGIWAIDFADEFPSASVIGFDISPIQPAWVPPNLRFEIDDAQLPWTYPADHFDFVHLRNLHGGISDWPALYHEAFRCTQPGGHIEHVEFNIRTLSDIAPPDHIYHRWNALFAEAGERAHGPHLSDLRPDARDPRLKSVGLYTLLFLDQSVEGFALYMLKSVMGWEFEEIQVLIAQMKEGWKQWKAGGSRTMRSGELEYTYLGA